MAHVEEKMALVKGGMPVLVSGKYLARDQEIEITEVAWYNTRKPVSDNFYDSLSQTDLDAMEEAVMEALREGDYYLD